MLSQTLKFATAAALALSVGAAPAQANDKEEAAAALAALALVGVAAALHNSDHYRAGREPKSDREIAAFERGYRDGLYNEAYDGRHGHNSEFYSDGYAAGQKERDNRLSHRNRNAEDGQHAPTMAMRTCVARAAREWGRNERDVHVTGSKKLGANDFYVEVAAGHRHATCEVSREAQLYNFMQGRMP